MSLPTPRKPHTYRPDIHYNLQLTVPMHNSLRVLRIELSWVRVESGSSSDSTRSQGHGLGLGLDSRVETREDSSSSSSPQILNRLASNRESSYVGAMSGRRSEDVVEDMSKLRDKLVWYTLFRITLVWWRVMKSIGNMVYCVVVSYNCFTEYISQVKEIYTDCLSIHLQ